MKFSRVVVALLVALILIAGVWIFTNMGDGNADEAAIEVLETDVIDADDVVSPNSRVVQIDGRNITLNPDPSQVIVIASSQRPEIILPTTVPPPTTDTNVVIVVTETPQISVPTADPTVVGVNPPTAARPVERDDIVLVQYIVQAGETLYGIARKHSTSVSLMAEYNIAQDHLAPGTVLNVPVASPNACLAGQRSHIVLEGETFFRISNYYGVTAAALRAANPDIQNVDLIYTGDVICIP